MAIKGTFLTSRTGRRIFWTLLLAAGVPIVVFGVALHAMLSDHFAAQAQKQQVQLIKLAGMGLLDRLLMARTALGLAARTGRTDTDPTVVNRRGRVLMQTAHVDSQGHVSDGASDLVHRWRESSITWTGQAGEDAATVALGPMDRASGARQVLMSMRRADRPGEVWIADIDTTFLFGELVNGDNEARVCVLGSTARIVFCPGRFVDATATMLAREVSSASWNLFLRSDFGIDDWTLIDVDGAEPGDTAAGMPLARLAALGAAATLLFVGMLGMVQLRRTMVPLERLIAGTRRLAERDFAARVPVTHADEFGELARSFNHMAERIGSQVQALHVQSSIDREILNGLNVERVLQRVAQRLEQLLPGAVAVVVQLDRTLPMLARIHSAGAPPRGAAITRADGVCIEQMPADGMLCNEPPAWLARALPRPATGLWVRCARAGDELFGMLAIGTASDAIEAPEVRREIAELADRVSVTLASADRERRLLERATRDSLTGLANRAGLYECIEQRLAAPGPQPFTVMFIDLDRFKEVNDSMGHQVGDELLRAVARRLRQTVPADTVVARPGGDEFVLVLSGPRAAADALAPVLLTELAQPVLLGGRSLSAGASIGLAHHPEHGSSSSDLMRRADMAMYEAKARGGGVATWFDTALDQRMAQRAAVLADLRDALERNEFELHFQPRIDMSRRQVLGAEALLRWRLAQHGAVPVSTVVELLEETALIGQVGLWVVEQACRQLAQWRAQGLSLETVAVNVSTRQLHDDALPAQVATILARHGLRPCDLELEVTESIFVGEYGTPIAVLRRMRDCGVRIALDDFGTGYSSLSYLHQLPIDVLKVDRSFVRDLGQRDSALALTRSIVALARALGLRVVAEGVETERQASLLMELGCDELQGFLFARPLDATAFRAFMARREALPLVTA